MRDKQLNQLIQQMENFQECWKQFNHFVNLTRAKFTPDDESHFLETKSIIAQELELILASIQGGAPSREEVHTLLTSAPSLRFLSQMHESALRGIETQWHKIYIGWHSVLGQLKVKRMETEMKSGWGSIFSKK